jgi:hypothetical protein
MIVLTDDAERRIAGAPLGSVCEEAGADAYPNQHNLPLPAPGRGRVARYNSDVDGNRGSYRTYSRPEYFAFEAARSARAIHFVVAAGDHKPRSVLLRRARRGEPERRPLLWR